MKVDVLNFNSNFLMRFFIYFLIESRKLNCITYYFFCNFYRLSHGSTIFQADHSPVETEAGGEGGEDAEQGQEDRPLDQANPEGKQGVHVRYS